MLRPHTTRLATVLVLVLVALVAFARVPSTAELMVADAKPRKPTPTPTQPTPTPDFRLDYNTYGYTDRGYVVRGGLPTCALCRAEWEPRFIDRSSEECFYGSNHFKLTSLNGFEGTVYIGAASIIPNGVTSEMAPSVFLPKGETVLVPFVLKAASDASGFGLVLVQAIGQGGTTPTHSIYHEIYVVDQMPPCQ
jgi:hypothetical protein